MDYGIVLATAADSWKVVKRAEELGYTHAWFFDTQLLNADVFVAMAAAAMATHRIKLCTGVLIPSNRIAPVAASALGSLNRLAPGRIQCGVGTGFTARRTMGVGALSLDVTREYIRVVRALLDRETVDWDYEGAARKIGFLNPDLDLINTEDPVPFHFSAFGPKGKALAAEMGLGWLMPCRDEHAAVGHLDQMRAAWKAAGRDPDTLYSTAQMTGCVLRDGEAWDSDRAIDQAGPAATMILHDLAESSAHGSLGFAVPEPLQAAVDEYAKLYESYEPEETRHLQLHSGHLMIVRPEERHLVTCKMIQTMSFSGTRDVLRDRIRVMRDAGYSQVTAQIRYGQDDMVEDWADVFGAV